MLITGGERTRRYIWQQLPRQSCFTWWGRAKISARQSLTGAPVQVLRQVSVPRTSYEMQHSRLQQVPNAY